MDATHLAQYQEENSEVIDMLANMKGGGMVFDMDFASRPVTESVDSKIGKLKGEGMAETAHLYDVDGAVDMRINVHVA